MRELKKSRQTSSNYKQFPSINYSPMKVPIQSHAYTVKNESYTSVTHQPEENLFFHNRFNIII
jgi:hypothetical protein